MEYLVELPEVDGTRGAMASAQNAQIGEALVDFSLYGTFPEEGISSRQIAVPDLAAALEALAAAKSKLEVR